mgnify:CR=1 FL=1
MQITVDNELKSYIRPLKDEEFEKLKESILIEGIRDPLVVWQGILLDGHHRYKIAQELGLEYKIVEIELPNKEAVKEISIPSGAIKRWPSNKIPCQITRFQFLLVRLRV